MLTPHVPRNRVAGSLREHNTSSDFLSSDPTCAIVGKSPGPVNTSERGIAIERNKTIVKVVLSFVLGQRSQNRWLDD